MQSRPAKTAVRTQAFLQSLYALCHLVISIKALRTTAVGSPRRRLTQSNPSTTTCRPRCDVNTGCSARPPPGMGRGIRFGPCCFRQRSAMQTDQSEGLRKTHPSNLSLVSRFQGPASPFTLDAMIIYLGLCTVERCIRDGGGQVLLFDLELDPTKRRLWDLPTSARPKTSFVHGPLVLPLPSTNPLI